jgi:hypothetical protein
MAGRRLIDLAGHAPFQDKLVAVPGRLFPKASVMPKF